MAYDALLSIVPLLILTVIALSQIIDENELLQTLGRYLERLIPGQSSAIVAELSSFLAHRDVIGWVLLATLAAGSLQAVGLEEVDFLGRSGSLGGASGALLYLLGFAGEIFVLTSVYLVMPVVRPSLTHALVGAVTAALLLFGARVIAEDERMDTTGTDAPPQWFTTDRR